MTPTTHTPSRARLLGLAALAVLGLAACGTAAASDHDTSSPGVGMCAPGVTDCVDVIVDDGTASGDEFPSDQARADAEALLGLAEGEFGDVARIGRRGAEHLMLTEDYVLGRLTVELDDDGTGVYRVVSVTVELPDGPKTISA